MVNAGAVPFFVKLLRSPDHNVCEQVIKKEEVQQETLMLTLQIKTTTMSASRLSGRLATLLETEQS